MQQFSEIVRPDMAVRNRIRSACLHSDDESGIVETMTNAVAAHDFSLVGRNSHKVNLWHDAMDLGGVSLHYVDYNCDTQRISVKAQDPVDGIVLKFPLSAPTQVNADDREYLVHPGEFSIFNSKNSFQTTMDGDSSHLTLVLENRWLENYFADQNRRFRPKSLMFNADAYSVDNDGLFLSGILASLVLAMSRRDYSITSLEDVSRNMKNLITSVVINLATPDNELCLDDCASRFEPRFLGAAESYLRENLAEEVDVEGVARHVGVSRRTLHAGFRRYRKTSPMAILKSLRLEAVQSALESAQHDNKSVTEIATFYGFGHLGRFSQEYRSAFGVLPSQARKNRL